MNMEKYTKKQRKEIYLKAAEYLKNQRGVLLGCCNAIKQQTGEYDVYQDRGNPFYEFVMFRPKEYHEIDWFTGKESNTDRINCMLLCAQMCDNP